MKPYPNRGIASSIAIALLCALKLNCYAQISATWINSSGGSWAAPGNWSGNLIANTNGVTAHFDTLALPGDATVTLDGSWTVGNLVFGDTGNTYTWEIDPGSGESITLASSSTPTITINNQTATITAVLAGTNGLTAKGAGTLILTGTNTYSGNTTINGGATLEVGNGVVGTSLSLGTGNIVDNGTLTYNLSDSGSATLPGITGIGTINTSAGQIVFQGNVDTTGAQNYTELGSGGLFQGFAANEANTIITGTSISMSGDVGMLTSADNNTLTLDTSAVNGPINLNISLGVVNGFWWPLEAFGADSGTGPLNITGTAIGGVFNVAWNNPVSLTGAVNISCPLSSDFPLTINATSASTASQILSGNMSLIKTGSAALTLTGENTYAGTTTVSNGTLEVDGSIGTGEVTVNSGAILDGSGSIGGGVTVSGGSVTGTESIAGQVALSGGTLSGSENIGGAVTASGSVMAVGTSTRTAILTINNTLTLSGGEVIMKINKTGGSTTSDQIQGLTGVGYDGTLLVSNITTGGSALAAGDSFTLFSSSAYSGGFTNYILPALGGGLNWDLSGLPTSGSIKVVSGIPSTIPPTFNPPSGGYVGALSVIILSPNPGGPTTIHYTTDGSNPTTSGTVQTGTSPVTVVVPVNTTSMTINAYATKSGDANSIVTSATYSTLATPTWINASGGSWASAGNWENNVIANASGVTAQFNQLTLAGDATVTLDGIWTVESLDFGDIGNHYTWELDPGTGGPLTLAGSSTPNITVNNQTATITAVLAGSSGLIKNGSGILALTTAANTYTGGTTINGGTLEVGNGITIGSLGSGTITNNGTLTYNFGTVSSVTPPSGSGLLGSGNLNVTSFGIYPVGNTTLGGALNYTQVGSGGLFQGFEPNDANVTLKASSISLSADIGRYNSGNSSFLNLDTSETNGQINLNISLGVIGHWVPLIGFSANAGTGPINVTGTCIGGVWNSPVTLSGGVNVSCPVVCNSPLTIFAAAPSIVSGVLSGGMGLTEAGTNTLVLSGNNNYTGTTVVSNGTLEVDGSLATASVEINSGSTLDGLGAISSPVSVMGGTLSAGSASTLGSLTINNALTLTASTVKLRISKTGGVIASDSIQGVTSLAYGGSLFVTNVTSDSTPFAAGDTFTLFGASTITGNFTSITLPALSSSLSWNTSGLTNGIIEVVAGHPSLGKPAVLANGSVQFGFAGAEGSAYRVWATTNILLSPITSTWSNISSGTFGVSPTNYIDSKATNYHSRFYTVTSP